MKVSVYHNGDDVFIAWKPAGLIPDCRGLCAAAPAQRRRGDRQHLGGLRGRRGQGRRAAGVHRTGRSRSTSGPTTWRTRATRCNTASCRWSAPTRRTCAPTPRRASELDARRSRSRTRSRPKIEAYFNRGIVAAQWVSRRLGVTAHDLQDREAPDGHRHAGRSVPQLPGRAARRAAVRAARVRGQGEARDLCRPLRAGRRAARGRAGEDREDGPRRPGQRQRQEEGRGPERRRHASGCATKIDLHDRMISPRALGAQQIPGRSATRTGSRAGCGPAARTGRRPASARRRTTPC